jgi:hypothetical protein
MLVLADRGFDTNAFLQAVVGAKAQLLVRAKSTRRPPVLAVLPDGSWLTRIAGLRLRVIDAAITVTGTDGTVITGTYRLFTTLTDHRTDPADRLVQLYHERWEIESAYYALRHTLLGGRVLRSDDQPGLDQELWGLLTTYQVLRMAMTDAAAAGGLDPDRASFTVAAEAARDTLAGATGILPTTRDGRIDLTGAIGQAILAHPLPARRARYSARKVKSPISRYHARSTDDDRPLTTTSIATVTTEIHQPTTAQPIAEEHPAAQPATAQPATAQPVAEERPATQSVAAQPVAEERPATQPVATQPVAAQPCSAQPCSVEPRTTTPGTPTSPPARHPRQTQPPRAPQPPASPSRTTQPAPDPRPDTTATTNPTHRPAPTAAEVLHLLRADPYRPWHGRDVAQILNVTNINSLCTRMSQWAHKGLLHKIGHATYTLTPTP